MSLAGRGRCIMNLYRSSICQISMKHPHLHCFFFPIQDFPWTVQVPSFFLSLSLSDSEAQAVLDQWKYKIDGFNQFKTTGSFTICSEPKHFKTHTLIQAEFGEISKMMHNPKFDLGIGSDWGTSLFFTFSKWTSDVFYTIYHVSMFLALKLLTLAPLSGGGHLQQPPRSGHNQWCHSWGFPFVLKENKTPAVTRLGSGRLFDVFGGFSPNAATGFGCGNFCSHKRSETLELLQTLGFLACAVYKLGLHVNIFLFKFIYAANIVCFPFANSHT